MAETVEPLIPSQSPHALETPEPKKQRLATARKAARQRLFKDKESYRWVEALAKIEQKVSTSTRVIHVFDREGDIAEVFDSVRQLQRHRSFGAGCSRPQSRC